MVLRYTLMLGYLDLHLHQRPLLSFFLFLFLDQNYYIERNNFLNYTCYFPRSLQKSLPYSQLLQIRRIYSSKEELEKQAKKKTNTKTF